jgi:hypothetical protein
MYPSKKIIGNRVAAFGQGSRKATLFLSARFGELASVPQGHSAKLSIKICLWSLRKALHLLRSSWQKLPIIVSSGVDGRILVTQIL